ncbi:MAG: hypothetical protein ACQGVC_01485 [Myxococcota bacterium]
MTRRRLALPLATAALLAGCSTTQTIPLGGCVSDEVRVYVDGRLLEENPDLLELDAESPHKLYFKRPGHEPQLIVLEPGTDADGRARLEPADVCAELVPVGLDRELVIEADEEEVAP